MSNPFDELIPPDFLEEAARTAAAEAAERASAPPPPPPVPDPVTPPAQEVSPQQNLTDACPTCGRAPSAQSNDLPFCSSECRMWNVRLHQLVLVYQRLQDRKVDPARLLMLRDDLSRLAVELTA